MAMGVKVELNKRSQELLIDYLNLCPSKLGSFSHLQSSVDYAQLISWLCDEIAIPNETGLKSKQETEFLLASLHAELLRDLLASMGGDNSADDPIEDSTFAKIKVILLALAGTLLAGCEGFDSITTMLSVLPVPSVIILIAGLSFSILSIVVFYSYDLVQVSKTFGVSLIDAPKLLNTYLLQMNEIKSIRKKIETYRLAELSTEELVQLENTIIMLQKRFKALVEASSQFEKSMNSIQMQAAKIIVTSLAGLLFFGSGFFAGQSVGMFIAGLFFQVVLPTFLPVVLFSVVVGLAALSLYWYVELVGLKQLVSGWFGLDEEKIDKLCNKNTLEKEEKKLENLKEKIISTSKLTSYLSTLEQALSEKQTKTPATSHHEVGAVKTSSNIYSFHSKVVTQSEPGFDLPDFERALVCSP